MIQPQVPSGFCVQAGPATVPSGQILVTTPGCGDGHFWVGQGFALLATQAQTDGELSKLVLAGQRTVPPEHRQMPAQSAPPVLGSQLSEGSSTHVPAPGHAVPASPPHDTPSDTHFPESQCVPLAHFTVEHGSAGGGLQAQVGQPFASETFPYAQ